METRICYRSSFSCEKYVSIWRQCSHEANEGHPISPNALTNARCRDSTIRTLESGHPTRTNARGYLHNRIIGSRSVPMLSTTTMELHNNNPLVANAPKMNKL